MLRIQHQDTRWQSTDLENPVQYKYVESEGKQRESDIKQREREREVST